MTLGVYLFSVLMFAFVTWIAIREGRNVLRDKRLAERIGEIGYDQRHGQVEIVTEAVLSERRR